MITQTQFTPERIKQLRKDLSAHFGSRCTQADLAGFCGVLPNTACQWEQGRREPSGSAVILLEILEWIATGVETEGMGKYLVWLIRQRREK